MRSGTAARMSALAIASCVIDVHTIENVHASKMS